MGEGLGDIGLGDVLERLEQVDLGDWKEAGGVFGGAYSLKTLFGQVFVASSDPYILFQDSKFHPIGNFPIYASDMARFRKLYDGIDSYDRSQDDGQRENDINGMKNWLEEVPA